MINIRTRNIELKGSNYEIGYKLGELIKDNQEYYNKIVNTSNDNDKAKETLELFDRWCPGLNEEIKGFADALNIDIMNVLYYTMTHLKPRCSQIGLLPSKTTENNLLVARNYEFSHHVEDFTLIRTLVNGKHAHIGTSVMLFGRDEGMNEHGLTITMSSSGFPVGNLDFMRKPAIEGLQFWAVIRSLLENCKNSDETLEYLKTMPIAYNLNLLIADSAHNIILFSTLDGEKEHIKINKNSNQSSMFATNHPYFKSLQDIEKKAMRHSLKRYKIIEDFLSVNNKVSKSDLKTLLTTKYPDGLTLDYYNDFLGTTKSIIFDVNKKTMELHWGNNMNNEWKIYNVNDELDEKDNIIQITNDALDLTLVDFISIEE